LLWSLSTTPLLVMTLGYLALQRLAGAAPRARTIPAALALSMLVVGSMLWDRRTDAQRIVETRFDAGHPFVRAIGPDAQVYWRDTLNHSWAMLGRASYFTEHQGSGVLFERKTAMEFERRRQLLSKLSFQREICMMLAGLEGNEGWGAECIPEVELIEEICRADGGPNYLIFPFRLPRGAIAQWALKPDNAPETTYHLHDCIRFQ
jgi:hypothetical protein